MPDEKVTRKAIKSDKVVPTDQELDNAGSDEVFDEIMKNVNSKLLKAGYATFKSASDETAGTKAPYYIRTEIPALDYAIGGIDSPGVPGARILEIYGAESHGKTTLALHILSKLMDAGGKGLIQDAEHVLTDDRIASLNIDTSKVYISQPEYLESAFEGQNKIIDCMKTVNIARKKSGKPKWNKPIGYILDSVASCPTKAEFEGEYDQQHMAQQARVMSLGLKKIKGEVAQNGVMAMYINQIRDTMNSYGAKTDTPGGRALKFYAAVRLEVTRVEWLKKNKDDKKSAPYGARIQVKVTKNKVAPPLRVATFEIRFDRDFVIDVYTATLDWLKDNGLIESSQGYYTLEGKKRRKNEAIDILEADKALWKKYQDMAYSIGEGAAQYVADASDADDDSYDDSGENDEGMTNNENTRNRLLGWQQK